jgi:hypothetical protein
MRRRTTRLRKRLLSALILLGPLTTLQLVAPQAALATTCGPSSLACDSFNRTVSGGWGNADIGGAWNTSGSGYSVTPGSGTIVADPTTPANFLAGVSGRDVDVVAEISPPPISSTQTAAVGVGLRYVAASGSWYQVDVYYAIGNNGGNYTVQLKRKPDNVGIRPDVQTSLAGGSAFWLRFEVQGTYPTTLRWKIWLNGSAEPAGWTDGGTDANAAQQASGGVGVVSYVNTGQTAIRFNSLNATTIASTAVSITCAAGSLACDSFNRTVSGGWGNADIGGAWNTSGTGYSVTPPRRPTSWRGFPAETSMSWRRFRRHRSAAPRRRRWASACATSPPAGAGTRWTSITPSATTAATTPCS